MMKTREQAVEIIERLEKNYPDASISLENWQTPWQLLVVVVLSAQCTDERVNKVSGPLFERAGTPKEFIELPRDELEELIRPTGFYRNKAKHLQEAARLVLDKHNGEVPATMQELTELPGVARKTANVILHNAFDKDVGITVDTHVKRISRRLGFTEKKTPEAIERDLMELTSEDKWGKLPYLLIEHGRALCKAPTPDCEHCFLTDICAYYQKIGKS